MGVKYWYQTSDFNRNISKNLVHNALKHKISQNIIIIAVEISMDAFLWFFLLTHPQYVRFWTDV